MGEKGGKAMSIIVRGIKMPETCFQCMISDLRTAVRCDQWSETGKAPSCPIQEIPEKHGRLIDADYVVEKIRHELGIKDISFLYNAEKSVVNQIFHAPTILEAEGAEE